MPPDSGGAGGICRAGRHLDNRGYPWRRFSGDGGPATAARLNGPTGTGQDAAGNIYIADGANHVVRKVDTSGIISTFAGNGTDGFSGDGGPATMAQMSQPFAIAFDAGGNVYISDQNDSSIREVNISTGIISTVAGNGTPGDTGDGGPATQAEINPRIRRTTRRRFRRR